MRNGTKKLLSALLCLVMLLTLVPVTAQAAGALPAETVEQESIHGAASSTVVHVSTVSELKAELMSTKTSPSSWIRASAATTRRPTRSGVPLSAPRS